MVRGPDRDLELPTSGLRVMIVAGESSGELYGALLARELMRRNPGLRIAGVGGSRMAAAGVDLLAGVSSALGAIEVLKLYRKVRRTFRKVVSALKTFRPHIVIPIDYPDFNIRVAAEARRLNIPVLYYVSPQVWAWRSRRVRQFGNVAARMAVVLPFEEEIYRKKGIPCTYVGHPIVDEIREVVEGLGFGLDDIASPALRRKVRARLSLAPERRVVTIMPGSRPHEVQRLLPTLAETIPDLIERYPGTQFVLPAAPNLAESLFQESSLLMSCHVLRGQSVQALLASDCAVIASGTSTLQAALLRVPMVVVYRLSPGTFALGKLLVRVQHISLVNILKEKSLSQGTAPLVRELLQEEVNGRNIVSEVSRMLDDSLYRESMLRGFDAIAGLFLHKWASSEVAALAEEICGVVSVDRSGTVDPGAAAPRETR
jgi:lipid-A-disaccharide synthase